MSLPCIILCKNNFFNSWNETCLESETYSVLVNHIDDGGDFAGGITVLDDGNASNFNESLKRLKEKKWFFSDRNQRLSQSQASNLITALKEWNKKYMTGRTQVTAYFGAILITIWTLYWQENELKIKDSKIFLTIL